MHDPSQHIRTDDLARVLDVMIDAQRRAERLPGELIDDDVAGVAAEYARGLSAAINRAWPDVERMTREATR